MSDIHLEFAPMKLNGGEVLLLAGDIFVTKLVSSEYKYIRRLKKQFQEFFLDECSKYEKVYLIAGNHEFYMGGYLEFMRGNLVKYLETIGAKNIFLLEKNSVNLKDGWDLVGTTLWTNFNNNNPLAKQASYGYMNDYREIRTERVPTIEENSLNTTHSIDSPSGRKSVSIKPDTLLKEFNESFDFLKEAVASTSNNLVVMTHHAPSYLSCHDRFGQSETNWSYYSNLENFILDNPHIKYWIHGHTHDSHRYFIGDCEVVCNPRGYPLNSKEFQNFEFDSNLTLEI